MTSDNKTTNQMFADKLVLGYPVWKGMLQVGSEMSRVTRRSFYQITMDGVPTTDSKVKENSIAAFVEYACQIPKVGIVSAGLRYEHVGFDYKDRINNDNSLERYTNDLFPSFSWANQWGAVQTSLSYSMKTQRPNYWMLNEAVIYINPYSLQTGDPKLKNAKTHSIGANARWKWFNLMANYERTDDALTQWSYIYNDKGVILVKNRNLDVPVRSVSVFLTASPTWGCYSPSWTVGMRKLDMKQTLADPREASGVRTVHYNRPLFVANLNNVFRLPHKWQLESYLYFQRKGDYMNFRLTNNICNLGFVVQKCWLKNDALCLRVTVAYSDPSFYLQSQHLSCVPSNADSYLKELLATILILSCSVVYLAVYIFRWYYVAKRKRNVELERQNIRFLQLRNVYDKARTEYDELQNEGGDGIARVTGQNVGQSQTDGAGQTAGNAVQQQAVAIQEVAAALCKAAHAAELPRRQAEERAIRQPLDGVKLVHLRPPLR